MAWLFAEHVLLASSPHFRQPDTDQRADDTCVAIERQLPALRAESARVHLYRRDYGFRARRPRWEASTRHRRRSILAISRNYLLARALRDEECVLWAEVDVARWPADVIQRPLAAGKDIVVQHCLREGTSKTYDTNTVTLKPGAEGLDWSRYIVVGLLQPPEGHGRLYLSDLRLSDLVRVDSV